MTSSRTALSCLASAGAVADAPALQGAKVGVIVSGGNVDLGRYAALLSTPA